jgi:rfaE bifunctional protein kinase chain/domain
MVKLIGVFSRLNPIRALVIGDFMYDTYTTGKIKRISPEAPVSVLHVEKQESLPGGAGNVALNLAALGAEVIPIGRVGRDFAGENICAALEKEDISVRGMIIQPNYQTPVKSRFIAEAQQVLRVDYEENRPLPEDLEQVIIEKLPELLNGVQVVAISDYGKGFLTDTLLEALIALAKKHNIPVIIDPKGADFAKYSGATLIKPNLQEAYVAAKMPPGTALDLVASSILKKIQAEMLIITRSEAGISVFKNDGSQFDYPVTVREVKDVTGAGDTVLATICMAIANGLDIASTAQLANIAAGIAIERLGCARITLSDIASRLFEFDVDNKVFDEGHLFALQQSLKGKKYCVLGLHSSHGMSTSLFKSIRELSSKGRGNKLIVYIRDPRPDEEFISLLTSLMEVDFVILKCDSLKHLCGLIHPHEVFLMEGRQLVALDHVNTLVSFTA